MNPSRIFRIIDRALIGAACGVVPTTLALVIASDYFRLFPFEVPVTDDRRFPALLGLGCAATALLVVVFGNAEFGPKVASTLRGMLAGAAAGVVAGYVLGSASSAQGAFAAKGATALGIFLCGPSGAILGGFLGATAGRRREPGAGSKPAGPEEFDSDPGPG